MPVNRKRNLVIGIANVVVVIILLFLLIFGRIMWPNNEIFKWIWKIVFLGVVPFLLIFGYPMMVKGKKKSRERRM